MSADAISEGDNAALIAEAREWRANVWDDKLSPTNLLRRVGPYAMDTIPKLADALETTAASLRAAIAECTKLRRMDDWWFKRVEMLVRERDDAKAVVDRVIAHIDAKETAHIGTDEEGWIEAHGVIAAIKGGAE